MAIRRDRWITNSEAADLLGIKPAALRTRRFRERSSHPPYTLLAGNVMYDRDAVARYRDGRVSL